MPQYAEKKIARRDRAYVALNLKNAQDKDKNAREYVEKLKERWGTGVSTLCLIYNATGDAITLVNNHDWYGHVGPAPIPVRIENGQWGGFLHVKPTGENSGSHGAVVYRGVNDSDITCDWMASWINPWTRASWDNTVYTEIRESGHYNDQDHWGEIHNTLDEYSTIRRPSNYFNLFRKDAWNGCVSTMSTGSDSTAVLEAIFTLENLSA